MNGSTHVRRVPCPACGGPGCEQCEGHGWVFLVPNALSQEEILAQIDALGGTSAPLL